ncbi:FHA domain-containing protein, partial [Cellulomonas citrea]|uniref:FHA domain-containing protein n=1 Tax=Cellulomonas citrea TaxID=1909423 RepID=UPI001B35539D
VPAPLVAPLPPVAPPVAPVPPVAPPVAPVPPVAAPTELAPPTVLAPPVVSAPPAPPPPAPPAQPVAAPALTAPPVVVDPDDEDDVEGTVVVSRTPFRPWSLHLDDGRTFEVLGRAVVLGRRPVVTDLGVQLLAVPDPTRTLSKTHARLDLVDDQWHVTDLGSTNGVLLVGADGTERPVDAGVPTPVAGRFVLGSVGMWLTSAADGAR